MAAAAEALAVALMELLDQHQHVLRLADPVEFGDHGCFHALVAAGGEGIILRNPASKYNAGRSSGFLKIKATADDEGVMVSHDGKAMRLEWNNQTIRVPMPSDLRKSPPSTGAKITFKFNGLTDAGIPRHATFIAVRDYE